MRAVTVSLPDCSCEIAIACGCLDTAGAACRRALPEAERLALVTDGTVGPLYAPRVLAGLTAAGFQARCFTVPAGEASKSLSTLEELCEAMAAFGMTRTDAVAALGGGVVGDLAGFAAAVLLRGIACVQLPTTLLAQADACMGGKTAVNLRAGKNLAGAFWHPRLVLADPLVLDTLPHAVFMDGMAEVVKYGCIRDRGLFDRICRQPARPRRTAELEAMVHACCRIKADLVSQDPRDTGQRMLLNFGHTLGHAYERAGGYARWSHGQAVAAGMCQAARLGVLLGVTPRDVPPRLFWLCRQLGLPTRLPCSLEDCATAIALDKKGAGGQVTLILLRDIGQAEPFPISRPELLSALARLEELSVHDPEREDAP